MYTEVNVNISDDDQCSSCKYYNNRRKQCPLIEAISAGYAMLLMDDLVVENCGFYEPKHLTLL